MLTEEDSKQANIQGIHCIIRPPQGIEDGVLVNFSFDFRKKEVSFFFSLIASLLLPGLYLYPFHLPILNVPFTLLYNY